MPRKRLPVRKIEEILRLRAEGVSAPRIATSIGAGRTTVYEYLARADAAGIGWPLPEGMDEAAVEAKLFPPHSADLAASRPVPNWMQIHRELKKDKHVIKRPLWLELLRITEIPHCRSPKFPRWIDGFEATGFPSPPPPL